jgi:osmoprotectant transport system substrate-binding protein
MDPLLSADQPQRTQRPHRPRAAKLCGAVLLTAFLAAGCASLPRSPGTGTASAGTVVVGSKNFTENEILAQMMADLLEAHTGLHVVTKLNMGGTLVAFNALRQGSIDLYPDYTGTGYIEILKQAKPASEEEMYAFVQQEYEKRYGLQWLKPFGFNDTYAVAVPADLAAKDHLTTLSSLIPYAPQLVAGIDAECQNRPDCLPGLQQAYGLHFKAVRTLDHSLVYEAAQKGDIQVTDAFSTDGGLLKYHLVVLRDDKHFFPAYYAAPVVRRDLLKAHPEVSAVLDKLAGQIDDATMQKLNYEVDVSKRTVQEVAHDFLVQRGLL